MTQPAVTEVVTDPRRRRALWVLVPVVTVVAYLVWGWQSGTFAADTQGKGAASAARTVGGSSSSTASSGGTGLRVGAPDVEGLAPGVVRAATVSITNDDGLPVRLDRVVGRVTGGAPAGCPASSIVVNGWTAPAGEPELAAGSTRRVPVSVSMAETGRNQDACKGALFTLDFTATGTAR